MQAEQAPSISDDSEEARAFLQARVTLFWKVMFFITLFGNGLGALEAVAQRGLDFWVTLTATVQAGAFWWLCRRGQRSVRFSRSMETVGIVLYTCCGATIGRFLLVGVTRDHALDQPASIMMADAYVSMLQLFGTGLAAAIRAALIPSQPRRTLVLTALFGAPAILATTLLFATPSGQLAFRSLDSAVLPWLPVTVVIMWAFVVITCTLISRTIYGLRVQVREARQLGQYTLEEKLGEGGMGVVYRASHGMLRRPTAIKLLLPDRAGSSALMRFEREVRRTAMLTHPNTVTVFDYGRTTDGVFYYAMELLEGASLDEVVDVDGPQPAERVIHLLAQAAASLAEAHDAGLIHRDVKPANILIVDRGGIADLVKVLDFGLVKDVGAKANGEAAEAALTLANSITGTPLYMAPETVVSAETVDARADLYALGAVGYWLLTGTHVFGGTSVVEVCAHHLHTAPEPPSIRLRAPVPADLEAVVLACLAKRPEDRPASAHVLRERLAACAAAGMWTNQRAASWWADHRPQLRSGGAKARAPSAAGDRRSLHLTVTRITE